MDDYIAKPIRPKDVEAALMRWGWVKRADAAAKPQLAAQPPTAV
jgi:hypothetical protein